MPSTADQIVYPPMVSSLAGRARTIFAGDLSYFCSEDDLFRFFSPLGRVLNVSIARKNEASLMYGFVEFESLETAEKIAQEYSGHLFMGRHLRIYALGNYTGPASYFPNDKPNTFCVHVSFVTHNLHKVINEEYLRQMFVSMNEDVYDVAIRRYYRQRHRQYGYAFVDFLSKDTAVNISHQWKERDHDGITIKCTLGHRVLSSQETDANVPKHSGDSPVDVKRFTQMQSASKNDSANVSDSRKDHTGPSSRPFHSKTANEDDSSNKAGLTFYRPNQPHPVAGRKGAQPQSFSTSGAAEYPYQAQPVVMDGSGFAAQPGGIMMYYPGSYVPVPMNAATSTSMSVPVMGTYPMAVAPSTYPSPSAPASMGMYYNQPPVQYAIPMPAAGMQSPAPVATSNQYPSNSGAPSAPQQYLMYPPHSFPQYHLNNGNGPPSFR